MPTEEGQGEERARRRMAERSPEGRPPRGASSRKAMLAFSIGFAVLLVGGVVALLFDATRLAGAGVLVFLAALVVLRWPVIAAGFLRAGEERRARRSDGARTDSTTIRQ